MLLKFLVLSFCVSMETCSLGIEVVCSLAIQQQYILELFKNSFKKNICPILRS